MIPFRSFGCGSISITYGFVFAPSRMASKAIGHPALQAEPTYPAAVATATAAEPACSTRSTTQGQEPATLRSSDQNAGNGPANATNETPPTTEANTGPAKHWAEGAAANVRASEDITGAPENVGEGGGEGTSGRRTSNAQSDGISATAGKQGVCDGKGNGGVAGPASRAAEQDKQLKTKGQADGRSNEPPATTKAGASKASPARSASMGPQASGAATVGGTRKGRWALKNQVGVAQPQMAAPARYMCRFGERRVVVLAHVLASRKCVRRKMRWNAHVSERSRKQSSSEACPCHQKHVTAIFTSFEHLTHALSGRYRFTSRSRQSAVISCQKRAEKGGNSTLARECRGWVLYQTPNSVHFCGDTEPSNEKCQIACSTTDCPHASGSFRRSQELPEVPGKA